MLTLKDIIPRRFSTPKSPFEYELCKYEDIQQNCIIHRGHLQYLHHTTMFGVSHFRNYLVVLTRIPAENIEETIGLYLFSDEKKSASYFFSIDQKTKITDRCNRNIKPLPKCFLIELKFIDKDKSEIFGAKDNLERQSWIEIFKNLFSKSRSETLVSDYSYLQSETTDKPISLFTSAINPAPFYPSFNHDYFHQINVKNSAHSDTHSSTQSDLELSPYSIVQPTDYSRSSANKNNRNSLDSCLLQENIFIWNDIFYSNGNDDYKDVLIKTGIYGTFLIRPHSKKTSSNDHDFTLCVYFESNNVRCLPIHQLPKRKNEYSLTKKDSISFVDMMQLCQYYTINRLPTFTKHFYLKKPYKFYKNNSYYIE